MGKANNLRSALVKGFRHRLRLLRWLVPILLILIVIIYEIGPSRWIYDVYGFEMHLLAEVLWFAAIGPALAFVLLDLLWRWLDERETSELQAVLLDEARQNAAMSRQLTDDALQATFATGVLIETLKSQETTLSSETIRQIEVAEAALKNANNQLRVHLLS